MPTRRMDLTNKTNLLTKASIHRKTNKQPIQIAPCNITRAPKGVSLHKLTGTNLDDKENVAESLLRNVISEVLRECKNHHMTVVPDCINYFVRLLALDPNRGLSEDFLNAREQIYKFVHMMLHWLRNQKCPKVVCIKLQHRFTRAYKKIENEVKNYRLKLENQLYPLMMSIVEPDNELPVDELYRKLAYYTTLISGTGNPLEKAVYKDSLQVLKSVFEMKEIKVFPKLLNFVRRDIVDNLVELTTGIKLYNKACKKGGAGVPDLPQLLKNGIAAMIERTQKTKDMMEARFAILTKIFEQNIIVKKIRDDIVVEFHNKRPTYNEQSHSTLKGVPSTIPQIIRPTSQQQQQTLPLLTQKQQTDRPAHSQNNIDWEYLRDTATAYLQGSHNLGIVLVYLEDMEKDRESICEEMDKIVQHLKSIIIPNLHQAASFTFPYFQKLSEIWQHLQNEAVRIDEINNIVNMQHDLVHMVQYDLNLIKGLEAIDNRSLSIPDEKLDIYQSYVTLMKYEPMMTLQYKGYCCWMMVMSGGALIPGKLEKGVIKYRNKYYTFSSNLAANLFAKNPEEYIGKVLELARREFHLIHFLQVHDTLTKVVKLKSLYQAKLQVRHDMIDVDQQTEVHPVESNIDHSYRWNLWDYKRQLLKQVDMVQMRTKATALSGLKSQFKNNQGTQTYKPKDVTTQTIKQNYANTDKLLSQLINLRGKKGAKPEQFKIWLKN